MPRVDVDAAFMASLMAELDADFDLATPPSSSQPSSRTAVKSPARPPRAPSASTSAALSPRRARLPPKHLPPPRTDTPFWDNPLAQPLLSQNSLGKRRQEERDVGIIPSTHGRKKTAPRRGPASVVSPKPNRGVKRERDDGGRVPGRAVKHVAVEVEERENAPAMKSSRLFSLKGKGKAAVKETELAAKKEADEDEFDAAELDGVDWDEVMDEFDGGEEKISRSKQFTRCQVQEVVDTWDSSNRRKKIISVSGSTFDGVRQVILCDDWVDSQIETGDTLNFIGTFDSSSPSVPALTLSRSEGLLILHPDILVSATKVADASSCRRKAVLSELIRTVGGLTPSLVYGNMLHELMQACLLAGRWDEEWRNEKIDEIVKQTGGQLWTMYVGFDAARNQMRERSKEYEAFAQRFVGDKPKSDASLSDPRAADTARSRLALSSTLSVEEDIWAPRFGLKGKIDVSVSSVVVDSVGFTRKGTTPFEIKTGRATAGMEHRAQTMLYTLLMGDRFDEDIDSGLLYYTQGNEVFRVQAARNEVRGLIIARNDFATYLHRRMTLSPSGSPAASQKQKTPIKSQEEKVAKEEDEDEDAMWAELDEAGTPSASQVEELALLPPPIDDEWACKKCYSRDACMLFRRTVEGNLAISATEHDPLQALYEDKTGHLTEEHAEFFKHWEKLISYEEQELVRFKKEIWTMGAEERQKTGRCFANMVIEEAVKQEGSAPAIHRFTYRLKPRDLASSPSLLAGSISKGEPVVVSLEAPHPVLGLSRGFVLSIMAHEVVLGLDHSLTDFPGARRVKHSPSSLVFRVDKDELAAGMGRIRDNLIQLFVAGGDARRRRLIVDLEPPSFDAALATESNRLIPSSLNGDQKVALEKVLAAQDYALILGMPGTGKTTTIAEVLKALAAAGKSVLLTSYTHSAVDNILLKVKDSGLSILRLGNRDKIVPALHRFALTPEDYSTSLSDIDNKLLVPQIVATTCLGINEPIFSKRRFDVCIVDEASQVTLPTCLGPLRFADKFILVGDHNQLPPLVRNLSARKGGLDISLFKRLSDAHLSAVVNLTEQYRMNEDIMLLSNTLVYEGKLKAGSAEVGRRRLELPKRGGVERLEEWQREVVDPSRTVLFVDTDALPARELRFGSLIENELEAVLVKQSISALTSFGVSPHDIGVITPYRQQIKRLNRELGSEFPDVEVLTADKSQGRDKEVVLVSLVRSNTSGNVGDLLTDWRRLNVCLTRAKSKLVLFGSSSTLRHSPLLKQFLELVEEKGWVYQLPAGMREGLVPSGSEEEGEVKQEEGEGEGKKPVRKGGGALALKKPLARDVVNSM
ncbi:hypothetical protein JCM8547_008083 [Rhodosporidiobolus lusitaniae]